MRVDEFWPEQSYTVGGPAEQSYADTAWKGQTVWFRSGALQPRLEHPVHDGLNHFESVEFAHVQRHQVGWLHGELLSLDRKLPASHQQQNTTLGYCCYNKCRGQIQMSGLQLIRDVGF
jgi:hypothetical protein